MGLGGQLDKLLASLAARCHVYLLSLLYCILFIARWQINMIDWLIFCIGFQKSAQNGILKWYFQAEPNNH